MRMKKIGKTLLCSMMIASLAAQPVLAAETAPEGEVNFWVKVESTNIPELKAYKALKYAASILTDGDQGKVTMNLEQDDEPLLSGSIYLKENTLYIALPELTDTVFTADLETYQKELLGETDEKAPTVNPFAVLDPEQSSDQPAENLWDSQIEWLQGIDYEALTERYLKYCEKTFEYVDNAVTTEDLPEASYEIDGEYVTCQGTSTVIPKEAMLRLIDATVDFGLRDKECRQILDTLFGSEVDFDQDAHDIQESIYSSAEEFLADTYIQEYRTPENEQAAIHVTMYSDDGTYLGASLINRGGETIDENFYMNYGIWADGESVSYSVTKNAKHSDSVTTNTISIDFNISDEEGYGNENDTLDIVTSYDGETGDYTLTCTVAEDENNLGTLTSYGVLTFEDGGLNLECENITWMSEGKYVSASAGLYGGELVSDLSFDVDQAKLLDLFAASDEEIDEEMESMNHKMQMIAMRFMLAQGMLTDSLGIE
ncbi:MAG: hypothetical protein Q4F41_06420 [Eubacteriales bacterium]|nr:hypothetical protein [Eubacteriales bacterium]